LFFESHVTLLYIVAYERQVKVSLRAYIVYLIVMYFVKGCVQRSAVCFVLCIMRLSMKIISISF